MADEQRQSIRLRSRLTTFLRTIVTGKVQRALTKDIGGGGACLAVAGVFHLGTRLELEIALPDRSAPIRCVAEVVWYKRMGSPATPYADAPAELGVKFVRIDPADYTAIMQYAKLNALPPCA
ncbi:MAG: PilZ domain-containing protein [Candidatus Omnitrophica bacterium]|nr:PilZ domain-containing protein [Candidatus Omnitrophota bacterium]